MHTPCLDTRYPSCRMVETPARTHVSQNSKKSLGLQSRWDMPKIHQNVHLYSYHKQFYVTNRLQVSSWWNGGKKKIRMSESHSRPAAALVARGLQDLVPWFLLISRTLRNFGPFPSLGTCKCCGFFFSNSLCRSSCAGFWGRWMFWGLSWHEIKEESHSKNKWIADGW